MIIRAMVYGAIIGLVFAVIYCISERTLDFNTLTGAPFLGAILAIPTRKWILRTFWM
ncbi:hypothetical protein JOC78_001379 [Bacillus ectoiniformans]|nr:hypothetical protein [Bacillus ectoiniformans]